VGWGDREFMKTGVTISTVGHAAALLWGMLAFVASPYKSDPVEAMPIDIVSATEFSQITAGSKTAPKAEAPKPFVEKVAPPKPAEDPTAKVVDTKEIKAAIDTPPLPEPKPKPKPAPVEKVEKKVEPKRDLIAEALKKEDAKKKPEPKKEAKVPTPPTPPKKEAQQPKFDPRQVEALLDKRTPQRLASAGAALSSMQSLGSVNGQAAQLSQSEIDALRARLSQCWNPPVGAQNAGRLKVVLRVLFNPDGTVSRQPDLVEATPSPIGPAMAESAKRAILQCQPFTMLRPEHYEQWKDIEITFDPRDMLRG
jgi:outer membrane biosynthesis protein TonB